MSVMPAQPIVTTVIMDERVERVERVKRRREMGYRVLKMWVSSWVSQFEGGETEYLNTSKGRAQNRRVVEAFFRWVRKERGVSVRKHK
jgi:hypothetical protein